MQEAEEAQKLAEKVDEYLLHESHDHHEDFGHKLMDYKREQTGQEYRLFGRTMASYDQLSQNVKHNQCVLLKAEHLLHTETGQKWLCQQHLDDFWGGQCIKM